MSKGSKRRPQKVADKQLQANWDKIFNNLSKARRKALDKAAYDVIVETVTGKPMTKEQILKSCGLREVKPKAKLNLSCKPLTTNRHERRKKVLVK